MFRLTLNAILSWMIIIVITFITITCTFKTIIRSYERISILTLLTLISICFHNAFKTILITLITSFNWCMQIITLWTFKTLPVCVALQASLEYVIWSITLVWADHCWYKLMQLYDNYGYVYALHVVNVILYNKIIHLNNIQLFWIV